MWLEFPETSRVVNMNAVAEVRIDTVPARGLKYDFRTGRSYPVLDDKYQLVLTYVSGIEHVAKEYSDRELAENALCAVKLAVKNNS